MILDGLQGKHLQLDGELLKKTGVFTIVSAELLTTIGGGYFVGKWLDGKLQTAPILGVSLATLGLVYSVLRILHLSKTWMKRG